MEANLRWAAVTAVAPIAWGSNYYVTAHFLPAASPVWGAVFRALPAGLLLLPLVRRLPSGSWWWRSLVLGTLNVGAFFVLIYVAAQLLPTSVAATVMATSPGVMMLLAWVMISERPRLLHGFGALIGLAGVALMVLTAVHGVHPWGIGASLLAMLMSSIGYILAKRWTSPAVSVLTSICWQLLAGGLLLLPIAALLEGAPPAIDLPAALGFGYVFVVTTAVAFLCWFTGLRKLPAGTVGLVGLLNPVTGLLLGLLVAGETLTGQQLTGMVLVLTGVLLGLARRNQPQRATGPTGPAGSDGLRTPLSGDRPPVRISA